MPGQPTVRVPEVTTREVSLDEYIDRETTALVAKIARRMVREDAYRKAEALVRESMRQTLQRAMDWDRQRAA